MIEIVIGGTGVLLLGMAIGAVAILKGIPLNKTEAIEQKEALIMEPRMSEDPLNKEKVGWRDLMEYCRGQHQNRDRIQVERFDGLTKYLDERFDNLLNQIKSIGRRLDNLNGKT